MYIGHWEMLVRSISRCLFVRSAFMTSVTCKFKGYLYHHHVYHYQCNPFLTLCNSVGYRNCDLVSAPIYSVHHIALLNAFHFVSLSNLFNVSLIYACLSLQVLCYCFIVSFVSIVATCFPFHPFHFSFPLFYFLFLSRLFFLLLIKGLGRLANLLTQLTLLSEAYE